MTWESPEPGLPPKTRRAFELHKLEGLTQEETARALGVSRKTVETYRGRMMVKLGIENLAGLVKFALKHGIIPLE